MPMLSAPLNLVPFAPVADVSQLTSAIAALGARAVVVSGPDWLAGTPDIHERGPLLILIGRHEHSRQDIQSMLATEQRPTLVLFGDDALDETIAARCHDFLRWPCSQQELELRLQRLFAPELPEVSAAAEFEIFSGLNLIGNSPAFRAVLGTIKKISTYYAPVLIEGETGTGKELAARAIHYLGGRRDYPFIPVNCGAIPDNLFENELFGHERGAFTDAREAQPGLVAQAQGGTLFLDEIDTLSAKGQVALLRFLQDQRYKPLGGKTLHQADVRVIAASNAALEECVASGTFRQDLWYRLRVLSLRLPPLRERSGDARLLAEHFLQRYSAQYGQDAKSLHPSLLRWLEAHSWPGNVRELENFIHRELLLTEDDILRKQIDSLIAERRRNGADRRQPAAIAAGFQEAKRHTLEEFEKAFLCGALTEAAGNVTLAARHAGKERRAFGKLLKKYGIDPEQYRPRD